MKKSLLSLNISELKALAKEYGQPEYRGVQLKKWLNLATNIDGMSDIPLSFREKIAEKFVSMPLEIIETKVSLDGSKKYLYKLTDGNIIEGVYMPHNYGDTLCVSTQVGCRMGCAFCASGIGGLVRNLTFDEILAQVIVANRDNGGDVKNRKLSKIVLMGSGEPLDNYDEVTAFLRSVSDDDGINVGLRNVSLSTCGVVPNVIRLADDNFGVTLSLSLHATSDEVRQKIMPIAKKYSIRETIDAVKYYFNKTGRRVIFEYSMIKDLNVDYFDAKRLSELTKGFACHVNLIKLNYVKEKNLHGCSDAQADRFLQRLHAFGVSATIRRSVGADVDGACGQLRRKFIKESMVNE